MERFESIEIGRRTNGTKIVRNMFINDDVINYLTKAQSYSKKLEIKQAKADWKYSQKNKVRHHEERVEFITTITNYGIPNMDLKVKLW